MMGAFFAVYLRELLILRRRLKKQLAAMAVSPLLYMVTFGFALGAHLDVDGVGYLEFLVPGLVAMGSMTQAFGIASEINIARFYSRVFEEIQASPIGRVAYVAGEVCAGLTRVAMGSGVIVVLAVIFGVRLHYGIYFWLAAFLNGFAFSALGIALAMVVKSHADQGLLNNFVITPMAFLGGTFFPVDGLPGWARGVLGVLPLTHASRVMRADALGRPVDLGSFIVLAGACVVFAFLAIKAVSRARD